MLNPDRLLAISRAPPSKFSNQNVPGCWRLEWKLSINVFAMAWFGQQGKGQTWSPSIFQLSASDKKLENWGLRNAEIWNRNGPLSLTSSLKHRWHSIPTIGWVIAGWRIKWSLENQGRLEPISDLVPTRSSWLFSCLSFSSCQRKYSFNMPSEWPAFLPR